MFKNILLILSILSVSFPVFAGQESYSLRIKVDGLACPFCAYGLEKKLEDYEGLFNLKIVVDEGYAQFQLPYGKRPDLAELQERVKKGGFTPKEFAIEISGTFKSQEGEKLLALNGLEKNFLLTGKTDGLKDGLKVRVEGELLQMKAEGRTKHPLTVKVNSWKREE